MPIDIFDIAYNDSTILLTGEHKFTTLGRVPAEYLLEIYEKDKEKNDYPDRKLISYIEKNLNELTSRIGKKPPEIGIRQEIHGNSEVLICLKSNKRIFHSENEANRELKRIHGKGREGKKITRAYECGFCSGWHFTSQKRYM